MEDVIKILRSDLEILVTNQLFNTSYCSWGHKTIGALVFLFLYFVEDAFPTCKDISITIYLLHI